MSFRISSTARRWTSTPRPTSVTLWYSGAKYDHGVYSWHLAWERMSPAQLLARVSTPGSVAARSALSARPAPPPLTNETAP